MAGGEGDGFLGEARVPGTAPWRAGISTGRLRGWVAGTPSPSPLRAVHLGFRDEALLAFRGCVGQCRDDLAPWGQGCCRGEGS